MVDKRKKYIAMLDTETAGDTTQPFVYDFGYAIVDKQGNVQVSRSYIVKEIFCDNYQMMFTAYFANKLPQYFMDIQEQTRRIETLYNIRKQFLTDCEKYNCNTVCAHNAHFDITALNNTERYVTKSKYRYFFPFDFIVWDTLQMARQTICKMPTYKKYCNKVGAISPKRKTPSATAENLYRFISKHFDFVESHTGLEDVLIEKEILSYCLRQHKRMDKCLYRKDRMPRQVPEPEEVRIARYVAEMWGE